MEHDNRYNLLLARMQRICSTREYCSFDIENKLRKENLSDNLIEKIVASLISDKFIDDSRYANAFAGDKSKFGGWGPSKIIYALKTKKISPHILNIVKRNIDKDATRSMLIKIMEQKLRGLNKEDDNNKILAKLIRFGLSRGFDYNDVYEISKQIIKSKE